MYKYNTHTFIIVKFRMIVLNTPKICNSQIGV